MVCVQGFKHHYNRVDTSTVSMSSQASAFNTHYDPKGNPIKDPAEPRHQTHHILLTYHSLQDTITHHYVHKVQNRITTSTSPGCMHNGPVLNVAETIHSYGIQITPKNCSIPDRHLDTYKSPFNPLHSHNFQ